ncbi:iron-sulfur cluster scaffold-like protein [Lentilactobacillus curieae]|uniref:Iron-sulfur cluster scaffold-like protein n=1 Tax=Lentilactobacillus curieae TaxID=1138822 RepID=A0A1S6QHL2_9LACO|nr:SUF system NifU family Fe-S cluster assembly protein [Lentilactobacillus curieae]AQW21092.1 iron-sulfur cluster scaffold-like protein [Lentilactobacillus curieae]
MTDIKDLYQKIIIQHANSPHNFGNLPETPFKVTLRNPSCGDVITVAATISDNYISKVCFTGSGCAISQASASMMTDIIPGMIVTDAIQTSKDFHHLTEGQQLDQNVLASLSDAVAFSTLHQFPTRVRCGNLAWHALDTILEMWGK